MYAVIETAYLTGDADAAAEAYDLLLPFANLPMMAGSGIVCFGSAHHALGIAALTTGAFDRAIEHLSQAVCRNVALGHWPAVNASRLRYAEALERRGDPTTSPGQARFEAGQLRQPRLWCAASWCPRAQMRPAARGTGPGGGSSSVPAALLSVTSSACCTWPC